MFGFKLPRPGCNQGNVGQITSLGRLHCTFFADTQSAIAQIGFTTYWVSPSDGVRTKTLRVLEALEVAAVIWMHISISHTIVRSVCSCGIVAASIVPFAVHDDTTCS